MKIILTVLFGMAVVSLVVLFIVVQRRRWSRVRRAMVAIFGMDQLSGLTVREAYVLWRADAITPVIPPNEAEAWIDWIDNPKKGTP